MFVKLDLCQALANEFMVVIFFQAVYELLVPGGQGTSEESKTRVHKGKDQGWAGYPAVPD